MRVLKFRVENKALFETWNKVNENKGLSYFEALRYMPNNEKNIKNCFSFVSSSQTYYHFKLDFQKAGASG